MKNKNTKAKLNDKQLSNTSGGENGLKQQWEVVKRRTNEFYSQSGMKIKNAMTRTQDYLNKASKKVDDYLGD